MALLVPSASDRIEEVIHHVGCYDLLTFANIQSASDVTSDSCRELD
jgi:hypothetical protein